ncbi:MAG: SDR family NAD(P)-dependent oxidoreductase [Desulfobacterium sp.]|jgi:3-hydroxy-3-methylglutaryl CoA synthase/NAD(P)-dependent dehydrogenase (short-subunit alcohol dehydrogenase family)/putative sterol carrier protein|nr:SDR family NAD(P)-dependent oxidoreductase [Desulfobacterium sp.]
MIGITSYGAYIPRLRLSRSAIVQNMGWFAPAIMAVSQGERSMCNWDEDSLTMAVAAVRDCVRGMDKGKLDALFLASTTLPFADRQNSGVVASAVNLGKEVLTADFTASQKVSTTALIAALEAVKGGERKEIMVAAADKRETKAAYFYEMWFGDGAAALSVGSDNVIAEYKGSYSVSDDFVDHYRGSKNKFDYMWEERWARDEGYGKIIPLAVQGLFDKLGITMEDVDTLIYPCFFKGDHKKIAKRLGATPGKLVDNLHEVCGETGTAHPFLMLVKALESARPGDRILVAGYGQGCNVLYFQVTDAISKLPLRNGFKGVIENRKPMDNYPKWLKFREIVETEMGIRAESPSQTAMTVLYRKNKMILGLVGGKCKKCDTPQFPKMDICVNPECGEVYTQEEYEFADIPAFIKTFTADMLAVSVDPPAMYGMIQFEGGGRFMADFTDCSQEELKVGLPVSLEFKRKGVDKDRGMVNYFWKAVPVPGAADRINALEYNGRVAVVTGAGAGLGRVYALELARRGASVVVNDLGGSRDGSGKGSSSPAEMVVKEIEAIGGKAVANFDSVATAEGGEAIIKTALDTFGRVDIVINNAGILRDKSFIKMEPDTWQTVLDVHLTGAYNVTRPAFNIMKENGYGKIIMTTSAAGLYGNFGQTNYSAAKMGLVGMMNTLKLEGAKYNIKVNTIAPIAASRLTEDILPPDMLEKLKPEFVAPLVCYLASEQCKETGAIFNAGMGYYNKAAILTGPTVQLGSLESPPTIESVMDNWDAINSMEGASENYDLNAALGALMTPPFPKEEVGEKSTGTMGVAQVFEKMGAAFNADAATGVDVVFQYIISGKQGGDWICAIKDNTCTIEQGRHKSPACTLKIADENFIAMMTGTLPPMQAYTSGKLAIEGDIMKSQLIEKLFGS